MTLLERTWPWLTEWQRNHCGAMQAEFNRNLPLGFQGKLFIRYLLLETLLGTAGHFTAGARYWRSCLRDRSQMLEKPVYRVVQIRALSIPEYEKLSSYDVVLVPSTDKVQHFIS